jgi:hypothetical protein
MISYWKGDGSANDEKGLNNGAWQGAVSYTAGRVGQAFDFNGASNYILVPDSDSLTFSRTSTIEAWVKPHSCTSTYNWGRQTIFAKWGPASGGTCPGSSDDEWLLVLSGSPGGLSSVSFGVTESSPYTPGYNLAAPYFITDCASTLPLNQWSHIVGVLNSTGSHSSLRIYLNGNLMNEQTMNSPWYPCNTHQEVYIGHDNDFTSYFDGEIDEVAFYNISLSDAEIQQHYQLGLLGKGYCEEAGIPDMIPPETTMGISGASQVNGIYTGDVSVTLTATDNQGGSGVKETKYRIDSGSWVTGTSFALTCALTCTNTVEYYSVDNNDNVEDTKYASISIDKRAANETVTTSGGTVANGAGTATVTIPASAYSQSLSFVIAPSEQSFVPMAPGMTQIAQPLDLGPQCYLIDNEADCQSTAGCEFNYDTAACQSVRLNSPATITMPGDCTGAYGDLVTQKISKYTIDGWISLTTCDYNDMGGGIYSCTEGDGRVSTWDTNTCTITIQTYSFSPFTVTGYSMQYCSTQQISQEGTWVVNYDVTDTYGNEASGTSQQIKVDLYPPSSYAQFTGVAGEQGWYTSDVVVDFVASDSMSGVKAVYYSLDNETWNTWAGPDTLAFSEKSMLYYYSRDNAGHVEAVRTAFIAIDKTAPVISVTETGTAGTDPWWISILDVTINATDTESGMKELCSSLGVEAAECVQAQ